MTVPTCSVAQAEARSPAYLDLRLEHASDIVAQREIREPDYPRIDSRRPVVAALAHRRNARAELHLSHRHHFGRPAGAVHGVALVENGGNDVVPRIKVFHEIVQ